MATRQCQILFPTLQVGVVRVYVKSGFFLPVPVLLLLLQGIYNTIHGPPRAQKCLGPRYFYSFLGPGPVDQWTGGPVDQWTSGPVDQWTSGPVDQWTSGPVDPH